MSDISDRLVEFVILPGVNVKMVMVEISCSHIKLVDDETERRTSSWLTKAQLSGLLHLINPIIGEMFMDSTMKESDEPRIVTGNGIRVALILRKQILPITGVVVNSTSFKTADYKVVARVSKLVKSDDMKSHYFAT